MSRRFRRYNPIRKKDKFFRRVAFKITYKIPNFDKHGDLDSYTVEMKDTVEEAIKWFRSRTSHYFHLAEILFVEEGTVEISEFDLCSGPNGATQRWRVASPWKPCQSVLAPC